jgi:hypothetical protein
MLTCGAMIIDTPGMRELGMWDVTDGLDRTFADVEAFLGQCRFSDCSHTKEPGCAVLSAIGRGSFRRKDGTTIRGSSAKRSIRTTRTAIFLRRIRIQEHSESREVHAKYKWKKQGKMNAMEFPKSSRYDEELVRERIMGPNPLKLTEELLMNSRIPNGATVMDLGCGMGLTSAFLVKEYRFFTFAVDLWISATENRRFFDRMGLTSKQVVPIHADATDLPFAEEFFDAVVSTDSYNFFGRDPKYLGRHLLPVSGAAVISISPFPE